MTTASVPTPEAAPPDPPSGEDAIDADAIDADAPTPPSRKDRRKWWILGTVSLFVVGAVLGALFVPTPYFLLEPGGVRPAEIRVDVDGAKSYSDDGAIMFTTVYIDQATLASLIRGALDDAVDVKTREDIYGDQTRTENRKVNEARMDLSKLVASKVALNYVGYPAEFTGAGARVLGVADGGPSDGILRSGDVITSVAGTTVSLPDGIQAALAGRAPGDRVSVTVQRGDDGAVRTVENEITLGAAEDSPDRPILGIEVEPDAPSIDSEVHVDVDSGEVTGPSAGLAWTLAIIDRLTPGSITDGENVAVTGEIASDGSVGPIGGIVQKVSAVKRAGVKDFIYPASTDESEQAAMREIAGDELELHPVHNIDEAVKVLVPGGVAKPAA